MRRYWEIDQTFAQPSESLLKKNLKESVKKQKEKGNKLEPVVISGRAIAKSWWGKAWCDNLEHYADFASRLERGKRYVRTGTVIDLKIQKGKIIARVQGTRKTPYRVEIRISPLTEQKCEAILDRCGKIETLERLLSGDFPDEMKELFQGEDGLFPQPSEISFQCSCPDWALMCKHVAAALYGVGARLDMNPALFFELRGIEIGRFVDVALANRVERMLENAQKPSARIMDDEEAAQKSMQYVNLSLTKTKEDGSTEQMTEEEKAEAKKKAEAFQKAVKEGADFAKTAKEKELEVKTMTFDEETTTPDEGLMTANKLGEGEVSEVIETDSGYYVLKVTSLLDREATDAEKESIAEERKEKQYKDLCEEWKKDVKIEVNEKVWDKISFEKKGIKMKQQEEIPYAEGSDTDKSDQE